ncbi:FAD-dependent oxidoreductase [Bradyrhizobium sp. RDM4]|uniref:FAD-dependent oxidoreductase n=1 Tax=Bradyrhizobium sp. RDM4 TaxID=3378765 RepID=UPI0038FC7A7D
MPPHREQPWDLESDLLVVGAGAAGMTAALVGALEGLKVVLCEKSDMVGGTTAFSAGSVWIRAAARVGAQAHRIRPKPPGPTSVRYLANMRTTPGWTSTSGWLRARSTTSRHEPASDLPRRRSIPTTRRCRAPPSAAGRSRPWLSTVASSAPTSTG